MKIQLRTMLADAYYHLGIKAVKDIDERSSAALNYLQKDRERYIEVAEQDRPEYLISIQQGLICKLIPLGRQVITDTKDDHIEEFTAVLSLMVADEDIRYVISYARATRYNNPAQNTYSFPVYRYTELEDIQEKFQVAPPHEITPVATPKDREIFGMIFVAIEKFGRHLSLNFIPHKTERAVIAAAHAQVETVTVNGKPVCGKLVPLARQEAMWDEVFEDHRYSCSNELCLLISDDAPRYILRTKHHYHYFRKIIVDDTPEGCIYEPTENKQKTTYQFVTLDDISEKLYPLYY